MAVTIEGSGAQAGGGSEPGNPPGSDDRRHLHAHDVMVTFGYRLNFHMHSSSTYGNEVLKYKRLFEKKKRSAGEESELSEIDSRLTRAEEAYILEQKVFFGGAVSPPSVIRDEMMSYFSNGQRSVARNNAAHPFSTAVASKKFWDADDYHYFELLDVPTARGEDPVVNKLLLDELAELEGWAECGDLPEVLSKAKTCFVMQLRFLKHVLTLPPDDANGGGGSWVTVVKKGARQGKTTQQTSGKMRPPQ